MKRIISRVGLGITAILCLLGLAAPAQAATRVANVPVLYVHGIAANGRACTNAGLDVKAQAAPLTSVLAAAGYTGSVVPVGYYCNDLNVGLNIDHAADAVAGPYPGSYDNNVPVERLAQDLAWAIYNTYTVNGQVVSIAAHSLGGLITYWALAHVGSDGYPASLLVQDVLDYSTPFKGADVYPADYTAASYMASWCGTYTQCNEAVPGSAFLTALAQLPFPSWVDYTVVGGGPADIMTWASASGITAQHKVDYYATSPVNYSHNLYIQDTSFTKNEPVAFWSVGQSGYYYTTTGSHSLAWGYAALASSSY